jgi:hypothetical protein
MIGSCCSKRSGLFSVDLVPIGIRPKLSPAPNGGAEEVRDFSHPSVALAIRQFRLKMC